MRDRIAKEFNTAFEAASKKNDTKASINGNAKEGPEIKVTQPK